MKDNLDPRAKLFLWLSMMLGALILPLGWRLWLALALVSLGAWWSDAVRAWLGFASKVILPTAIMLVVTYVILIPPPPDEQRTWFLGLGLRLPGLWVVAEKVARLMIVAGATISFHVTTSHSELACGLRSLCCPTPLVKMIVSAFSLYPVIVSRIRQIADAQRSRGLRPSGLLWGRLRVYLPILSPLFFTLMSDSLERSALWGSRGYFTRNDHQASLGIRDRIVIAFAGFWFLWGGSSLWIH